MRAIAVALALLDFAPVFFLSLGLFFLAQLVDRLDPRCWRMALSGFALVTLGGLARAASSLALAFTGQDIPLLDSSLYAFAGPGFTLMAASLIRGRATSRGRLSERDPWLAPTSVSWMFLLWAMYVSASSDSPSGGFNWRFPLVALAFAGSSVTCASALLLGWVRRLHMAAALYVFSVVAVATFIWLRAMSPQSMWIQLFGELLHLAAQAAFAFASWRVAAEYQARIGPIATT